MKHALEDHDAALYALLHRGTPGDVEFYLEQCRGAEYVLELGCGEGRVAVPLAAAGHHVTGVDLHGGLLRRAQAALQDEPALASRLELLQADMTELQLRRRFDRVIVPYSGLYCLLTEEAVRAALRVVRAHLRDGGKLIFDAYPADDMDAVIEDSGWDEWDPVVDIEHAGARYRVDEQTRWWPPQQRITVRYAFIPQNAARGAEPYLQTAEHRYLFSHQIPPLLRDAGLEPLAVHGDFQGGSLRSESERLVVIATTA